MVRFLHSGDWQLGMTRRFLGDEAQARFTDARFEAVRRLAALAGEQDCAFAVVCGDVFESNQVDRRTVARALEALATFPVPVYLLPGNHDPLDAASVFRAEAFRRGASSQVHVLGDAPVEVAPGVELLGAPWTSKRPVRDLVAARCADLAPDPRRLRILAAHGAVDALGPERDDPAAISLAAAESACADGRIHYLALGDRHSRTRVGDTGRIHYAGTPEPTDWDEVDPGWALVAEVDADTARVVPHRVGSWHFERRLDVALDDPADLDALEEWLAGFDDKARTVLRLAFRGTLDLRLAARLECVLDAASDLFACVEHWERASELVVRADDGDFGDLALAGFAAEAVARLRERAAAGPDAGSARDALALLVRLAAPAGAAP
jgi:DNA repair exonuclease SbcCD nuclease subunit